MPVDDNDLLNTTKTHTWVGTVAADKDANSITIQVMIPEMTPAATGKIAPVTSNQQISIKDINGNPIKASVTTSNTITAYYLGNTSNRKYPPDVVRGERVRITRLGDSDKYYWESLGRDDSLRRTETHRIEVANKENQADPTDDDHTYSAEIDTKRNKHIRLKTSKGGGEKFAYTLTLDGGSSVAQLSDDSGNSVIIDSANTKVIIRNNKNAFVMLNGLDVVIGAPRDIVIKAGRQALITSPLITVAAVNGNGVLSLVASTISGNVSSLINLTSPAIGLDGAVQVPNILSANNIKSNRYVNGTMGAVYPKVSVNLSNGSATVGSPSPDTAMPSVQRHAAAYEDVNTAMGLIISCFNEIQSHLGYPTSQTGIQPVSTSSEMNNLQGT